MIVHVIVARGLGVFLMVISIDGGHLLLFQESHFSLVAQTGDRYQAHDDHEQDRENDYKSQIEESLVLRLLARRFMLHRSRAIRQTVFGLLLFVKMSINFLNISEPLKLIMSRAHHRRHQKCTSL